MFKSNPNKWSVFYQATGIQSPFITATIPLPKEEAIARLIKFPDAVYIKKVSGWFQRTIYKHEVIPMLPVSMKNIVAGGDVAGRDVVKK